MSDMSDYCIGVADQFKDDSKPFKKLAQSSDGVNCYIKMPYGYATKWDGKPQYRSWYA